MVVEDTLQKLNLQSTPNQKHKAIFQYLHYPTDCLLSITVFQPTYSTQSSSDSNRQQCASYVICFISFYFFNLHR